MFDFMEAYRKPQPAVAGEIVDARKKSFDKLCGVFSNMKQVYELCRLAFDLPQDTTSLTEWFQPPIKEFDPRFSLSTDKAEAARIAALLLRNDIARHNNPQGALAVLVCSFGGKRNPVDPELLDEAHKFLTERAKAQRIVVPNVKIFAPAAEDLKATLDAMNPGAPATIRAGVDAVMADARHAVEKTALSASEALRGLQGDMVRLAEEVDMLWWHIGDWTEKLGQPRHKLSDDVVGVVSGIELGGFVRDLPGPLGAFGILRRALGKQSDKKMKLSDVIGALGEAAAKLGSPIPHSATAVFPVHAAIQLASQYGAGAWESRFDREVGQLTDFDLSSFNLAVQAFRERSLIKSAELGE
jgi:hypothetical protein